MLINHPKLLLRKKTEIYPTGRTSYRFKNALRKKVTIFGKSAFNLGGQKEVFVGSERNYKETEDEPSVIIEERKE
jgi:hypothetical protein